MITEEEFSDFLELQDKVEDLSFSILSQMNDIFPVENFEHFTGINVDNRNITFTGVDSWGTEDFEMVLSPSDILYSLDAREELFDKQRALSEEASNKEDEELQAKYKTYLELKSIFGEN